MFSALSHWWQRRLRSGRTSRPPRRRRGGFRPRIEALEDRCVPALLTVTNTSDDVSVMHSLRWAVANAHNGDTIQIQPQNNGQGLHIVLTHGELLLNHDVTIDAVGPQGLPGLATIDGNNTSRVFEIAAGHKVTLRHLNIENGNAVAHPGSHTKFDGAGGGILNKGNLEVDNCQVFDNGSDGEGTVFLKVTRGGGVYNTINATLGVNQSEFFNNFANFAGGGIYNERGLVVVAHSTMINNSTFGDGGAIFDHAGVAVQVIDGNLSSNVASRGGALFTLHDGDVMLSLTLLSHNSANMGKAVGGAVFDFDSTLVINDGSTLQDNHAFNGGGIYTVNGGVTIDNSSLIHNTADTAMGNGGGIYSNASFVDITNNSHLVNNTAGSNGGAIVARFSDLMVSDSEFSDNTAGENGGAIYHWHGTMEVTGSTLRDNTATIGVGGALFVANDVAVVTGSQLITNHAAAKGGGIDNGGGGTLKVGTTLFQQNTPKNIDGAPYTDMGGNTFII
jgi:hypothetical protein